jgi:hypothetical protein
MKQKHTHGQRKGNASTSARREVRLGATGSQRELRAATSDTSAPRNVASPSVHQLQRLVSCVLSAVACSLVRPFVRPLGEDLASSENRRSGATAVLVCVLCSDLLRLCVYVVRCCFSHVVLLVCVLCVLLLL